MEPERKKRKIERSKENENFLFEELFQKGDCSDVCIKALGRHWKLHKVYLKQLPYFARMFSGDWKEGNVKEVELTIFDHNITAEGIHFIFESLYRPTIAIPHDIDTVSLMAAASMFGSEEILKICALTMADTSSTVAVRMLLKYFWRVSDMDVMSAVPICFPFILGHIVHDTGFWDSFTVISPQLMENIVSDVNLAVIPNEMAVFRLLVRWMYKQLHPQAEPSDDAEREITYFNNLPGQEPFLCTQEGSKYKPPFGKLRLSHIVADVSTYHKVHKIIPNHWITPCLLSNYSRVSAMIKGVSSGTQGPILEEERRGMRLGLKLPSATSTLSWRWPGFLSDTPLYFTFTGSAISCRRTGKMIGNHIRLAIGVNIKMRLSTETQTLINRVVKHRMWINNSHEILRIPDNATYPLYFCVELLLTTDA